MEGPRPCHHRGASQSRRAPAREKLMSFALNVEFCDWTAMVDIGGHAFMGGGVSRGFVPLRSKKGGIWKG